MTRYLSLPFLIFLFAGSSISAAVSAQTRLTFRIDMRPQMKDRTFLPGRHAVEVAGNRLPFSKTHTVALRDRPPVDSIYVATVHFPSLSNGKVLQYRFLIRADNTAVAERRYRIQRLRQQKAVLPIVRFNSFGE